MDTSRRAFVSCGPMTFKPTFVPPESFSLADWLLDARVREGKGDRVALRTVDRSWTYREIQAHANRWANFLRETGVQPEQRVLIALPDGADYVGALFGTLKLGAVVVMANPELKRDAVAYFLEYTRAKVALVAGDAYEFEVAAEEARHLGALVRADGPGFRDRLLAASDSFENFPSHRDDAAVWLFSGGTTGFPKAVVQTHRAFAYTTECYGKGVLRVSENDVTLSVPKLFFGYATGANLFFPFSVGATVALFPERCTADRLFDAIEEFRPTILVNVPTMIHKMVTHEEAHSRDLSSLRLATSAGEALPPELWQRWTDLWGVDLLDGLGTAEMWHVFLSARPGDVRPGTLGKVVPGFEVKLCNDDGHEVPDGDTGWLWVRGGARAIAYWQQQEKTEAAFRGEWYVSGDMLRRDEYGHYVYCGRGDDM
ncbi:MAG: AMP-binding protein, partial [Gemmatimonadetes bacterium]|nr:AMP-binding protein [Gemmatimonadota bacterium]